MTTSNTEIDKTEENLKTKIWDIKDEISSLNEFIELIKKSEKRLNDSDIIEATGSLTDFPLNKNNIIQDCEIWKDEVTKKLEDKIEVIKQELRNYLQTKYF